MLHHTQNNSGFTLVETLVAISILLLVVVGQMTVAQRGIQNSFFANQQMVAVFLAQEAIELVRTCRDDVAIAAFPGGSTGGWASGCEGDVYGLLGEAPDLYTRDVQVGALVGDGVPVTVTVSWDSGLFGDEKEVVLQTWVYDHYRRFEDF